MLCCDRITTAGGQSLLQSVEHAVRSHELPAGGRGLRLETRLNGELVQSASTEDMIFDVPTLISLMSEVLTLEPGDVIVSGTPAGIGWPVRLRRSAGCCCLQHLDSFQRVAVQRWLLKEINKELIRNSLKNWRDISSSLIPLCEKFICATMHTSCNTMG